MAKTKRISTHNTKGFFEGMKPGDFVTWNSNLFTINEIQTKARKAGMNIEIVNTSDELSFVAKLLPLKEIQTEANFEAKPEFDFSKAEHVTEEFKNAIANAKRMPKIDIYGFVNILENDEAFICCDIKNIDIAEERAREIGATLVCREMHLDKNSGEVISMYKYAKIPESKSEPMFNFSEINDEFLRRNGMGHITEHFGPRFLGIVQSVFDVKMSDKLFHIIAVVMYDGKQKFFVADCMTFKYDTFEMAVIAGMFKPELRTAIATLYYSDANRSE